MSEQNKLPAHPIQLELFLMALGHDAGNVEVREDLIERLKGMVQ